MENLGVMFVVYIPFRDDKNGIMKLAGMTKINRKQHKANIKLCRQTTVISRLNFLQSITIDFTKQKMYN